MRFFLSRSSSTQNISPPTLMALMVLGGFNIYFCIMLLSYKKSGFYGFIVTTAIAFIINICIGISPLLCLIGLCGLAALYGIFQIKRNGIPAWKYLK